MYLVASLNCRLQDIFATLVLDDMHMLSFDSI